MLNGFVCKKSNNYTQSLWALLGRGTIDRPVASYENAIFRTDECPCLSQKAAWERPSYQSSILSVILENFGWKGAHLHSHATYHHVFPPNAFLLHKGDKSHTLGINARGWACNPDERIHFPSQTESKKILFGVIQGFYSKIIVGLSSLSKSVTAQSNGCFRDRKTFFSLSHWTPSIRRHFPLQYFNAT